jgi:UDPglucose 6-dehydrogenase
MKVRYLNVFVYFNFKMKLAVFGTGYVGLIDGTCLADLGNDVICVDIDKEKIDGLNKGIIPIYEPGLSDVVIRNVKEGRLLFTIDAQKAIQDSDIIFIAVGTPSKDDGSVNLAYVDAVAKTIAENMDQYKIIVNKSTVPVGTSKRVRKIILENQKEKIEFDVVSNPEFLKEGSAIKDFFNTDRTVIGTDSEKAAKIMTKLFKPVERVDKPILITDNESAEIIKYASNAFLATKISFINEISRLCEKSGANVRTVARGMGLDKRIGTKFLHAGIGYGGSCFPKDVSGLINTAKEFGVEMRIVQATEDTNIAQKKTVLPKLKSFLPDLKGKKIGLWGLSFKPKTDDIRDAPALVIIKQLQDEGAEVYAFDPEAMDNVRRETSGVKFGENPVDTIKGCDALIIATEWDVFRNIDPEKIKSALKEPIIIDGRNIYDSKEMAEAGFKYKCVGI